MTEKTLESLDLNLLVALHWLLTEQNVTAAAEKVGLSQPAMSRALGRLRDVFGDPLLVKSGSAMALTPLAQRIQPAVSHAIERCRDVFRISTSFDPATADGLFRIASVDYIGGLMAKAWANCVAPQAPSLDLDLRNVDFESGRDLVSGQTDLVIMPDPTHMNLPPSVDVDQFVRKRILNQKFRCAVRKGHPIAKKNTLTLEDFLEHDHILISPMGERRGVVDEQLEMAGLERRISYSTFSFLTALPILQNGDCIITAPEGIFAHDQESVRFFDPPVALRDVNLFAGWHPNWTHDAKHKWVREKLFDQLAAEFPS